MRYEKAVNEFKAMVKNQYKVNDCSRPKKNTKSLLIVVQEKANRNAEVSLNYTEEFYRSFGKHNSAWVLVFEGDLKKACEVARELKMEVNFQIKFREYIKLEMF